MAKRTTSPVTAKSPTKTTAQPQPEVRAQEAKRAPAPERSRSEHVNVTYDMVAQRAYEIWRDQGGSDFDNWIKAERELRSNSIGAN